MKINKLIVLGLLIAAAGCGKYKPNPTHVVCWPEVPALAQGPKGAMYATLFEIDTLDDPLSSVSQYVISGTLSTGQEFSFVRGNSTCISVAGFQPPSPPLAPAKKEQPKPETIKPDAGPSDAR